MRDAAIVPANVDAIAETVNAFAPGGDWRPLGTIAHRESRLNHLAHGVRVQDTAGSRRAYRRNIERYKAARNPWADNPGRWHGSMGLYQMMPANHLYRWDAAADPHVLFHPVIATVIAARLINRAEQLGARNLCDVRQIWATGKLRRTSRYGARCRSLRKRLETLGLPEGLASAPLSEFGLAPFGLVQDPSQDALVSQVCAKLGIRSDELPERVWVSYVKPDPSPRVDVDLDRPTDAAIDRATDAIVARPVLGRGAWWLATGVAAVGSAVAAVFLLKKRR